MELVKYKDVLTMAKEKVKELMAPLRAREMRKKAEHEVSKLECEIAEREQKIQEILTKHPVNFDDLIWHLDEVELTKRRKEQFEKIINDVFSD